MPNSPSTIKAAVFPVAGLGTRFLPITKSSPKEMLSIIDKPIIQYAVEEAVAAGIKQLIFITNATKRSLEDYFDTNNELEQHLLKQQKHEALNEIQEIIPQDVTCIYVRQKYPKGLGDAVLTAKNIVGKQAFAVLLADDVIERHPQTKEYSLQQLLTEYKQNKQSILSVEQVPKSKTMQYGIVNPKTNLLAQDKHCFAIQGIIEKPAPDQAPSAFGVIGRYILTPRIFHHLEQTPPGANNEIQLTDAIASLLQEEKVYACKLQTRRFDCGSKLGYLEAILSFGLKHHALKEDFSTLVKEYAAGIS
jgi:UTP--glucose-1-phosphate uridylyltransferase|tara:strand:- start:216 stop:1130 length:915 start_codon:yes stop_codon:yes gene_type:complete